jgi:aconitate hydratase
MDRHVVANLGTEMGATTTVFLSDEKTLRFMSARGREVDWVPLAAEPGCGYNLEELSIYQILSH